MKNDKKPAPVDLEKSRRQALVRLTQSGLVKAVTERLRAALEAARDLSELASAEQEVIHEQLKALALKLLPPESSPFDPAGREWRRGKFALEVLHGEYEFASAVSEAQRQWWYERSLDLVQGHARLYAQFFEGELILL